MRSKTKCFSFGLLLVLLGSLPVRSQPFSQVSLDSIPANSSLAGAMIQMDGRVAIGPVSSAATHAVAGTVESQIGGFAFPDGSTQATAAASSTEVGSLSTNSGLYNNRIPLMTGSVAYIEVCFGNGSAATDFNAPGSSTSGGNCNPGDTGWVIEVFDRPARVWSEAKFDCALRGMRLPEVFEFQISCIAAASFGLADMTDDKEWVGNSGAIVNDSSTLAGYLALSAGEGNCLKSLPLWVTRADGTAAAVSYRCSR
jgi:hypothetical protein